MRLRINLIARDRIYSNPTSRKSFLSFKSLRTYQTYFLRISDQRGTDSLTQDDTVLQKYSNNAYRDRTHVINIIMLLLVP